MAALLLWVLAFWPVFAGVEMILVDLGYAPTIFQGEFVTFGLTAVWLLGMYFLYTGHFGTTCDCPDASSEEDESDINIRLIVDAPDAALAQQAGFASLEREATFESVPHPGKLLVLSLEGQADTYILGTVQTVAENLTSLAYEAEHVVWLQLEKPERFVELSTCEDWEGKAGKYSPLAPETRVRTTQPNPILQNRWDEERDECQWGAEGKVIEHFIAVGLCYEIEHADGSLARYHTTEIEAMVAPSPAPE